MSNITLLNCVGGHSFGHLMSTELLKDDRVIFAAYKNIHPLKTDIELSIVTLDGVDALTVYKEVESLFNHLSRDLTTISFKQFHTIFKAQHKEFESVTLTIKGLFMELSFKHDLMDCIYTIPLIESDIKADCVESGESVLLSVDYVYEWLKEIVKLNKELNKDLNINFNKDNKPCFLMVDKYFMVIAPRVQNDM